ncbi:MAG: GNAT family N-acetyltransferase [Erysipelotrichaceae bacterium]|nr:GNAT family N-acetyltransferase [Erysipelotrichaceae bacterium]
MLRTLEIKDFETLNNLINDPNYIIDEAELKKISKVYLKDDKIIGYISYQIMYERAELNYIFVKEEERKKGVASKMLEYMLNNLKEECIETIDLEVNSLNKKAINLYQKYGFKTVSIRKKYYDGIDGFLMLKEVK